MKKILYVLLILIAITVSIDAQGFKTPRPSPYATVSQVVGITNITINYSSPAVKGRKIWGDLVPFGQIWRTGANEVTSIIFSEPVKINGHELSTGTYGIHTIPGENEWEIIFSKDTKVDDGPAFNPEKEILRIKVKPESNQYTERMAFTITDTDENSANVNLLWEKLRLTFSVNINTQELVLQNARNTVDWRTLSSAANYCLQNNVNMDEGFNWIQASTLITQNYSNMSLLAQYYAKMNRKSEAISTMEKAIDFGSRLKNPPFDLENMKKLLADWKK